MSRYHFNILLDTCRLIRGIFFKQHIDPFIETQPQRIFTRKYLFQFSSIENESGIYINQFGGYKPYISSQPLLMQYLPERFGRDSYNHLMNARHLRLKEITRLLESYEIVVAPTVDCWENIGQWLLANIEGNKEPLYFGVIDEDAELVDDQFLFRPLWYSILLDLSLLLGEHVMVLRRECSWQFWGDINIKNSGGSGRSLWVLCEPLPKSGSWDHKPNRFLPYDLLVGIAAPALKDSLQGKSRNISLGLMFSQLISSDNTEDNNTGVSDTRVSVFLEWYLDYRKMHEMIEEVVTEDSEYSLDVVDSFLKSYVEDTGFLPPASDMKLLIDTFKVLPEWVSSYQKK